jgi:hypothetical protein
MQYRATLEYDVQLVRRAVRSYWRRSMGWSVLLGVPLLGAVLANRLIDGDRSWQVGLLAGTLLLGVAMPIAVYCVHYRNSMAKLRQMRAPRATFIADDESFTLASESGSSTLKWDSVKEIWVFEGYWLLMFTKAQFVTIPLAGVPAEMRAFVLHRVKQGGGKVPA